MKNEQLHNLTEESLILSKEVLQKFEETRETERQGDFNDDVLPFSNRVTERLDLWEQEVTSWIRTSRPRNLNEEQIKSLKEQLEMLAVQAFFPKTSKARFIHTFHSVEYVLKAVFNENNPKS